MNIYSPHSNKTEFAVFNEDVIWKKHSLDYITSKQREVKYIRNYDIDFVNKVIEIANNEGCLVSYNHPVWSLQNYSDYIGLKGLWGIEWFNSACNRMGYIDKNQLLAIANKYPNNPYYQYVGSIKE